MIRQFATQILGTAFSIAVFGFAPSATAQYVPLPPGAALQIRSGPVRLFEEPLPAVAAPVEIKIVEVSLEDPIGPEAKSYLDLDSGKVFTYGESKPQSFLESRRWIGDSGADLMCETRAPAEGLVVYDMELIPTSTAIDKPREYAELKKQLDETQPEPFQMMSAGASLPKTYLFRTREGAVGVLEIIAKIDNPAGMRLRYKIVPKPPPVLPPSRYQLQFQANGLSAPAWRNLNTGTTVDLFYLGDNVIFDDTPAADGNWVAAGPLREVPVGQGVVLQRGGVLTIQGAAAANPAPGEAPGKQHQVNAVEQVEHPGAQQPLVGLPLASIPQPQRETDAERIEYLQQTADLYGRIASLQLDLAAAGSKPNPDSLAIDQIRAKIHDVQIEIDGIKAK